MTNIHQDDEHTESLVPFFTIWSGQAISLVGSGLVQFALVWWLTKTTSSAAVLTFATLVAMLPKIILGPVIGALVDRWSRRIVMIAADSLVALAAAGLTVLFTLDAIQVWHVYGLIFVRALGGAFHHPAMVASTTLMVPRKDLVRIQGMNQALGGTLDLLAPTLGALLLEWLPMQGILAIDVSTALAAILPLCFISIPQPEAATVGEGKPSVLDDVRAGLHLVWNRSGLLLIIIMHALVYLLMVPAYSLLPLLVSEHLGGGALQLAWLQAANVAGSIASGLLLTLWGGFRRQAVTMLLAQALSGVSWIVIGIAPANCLPLVIGMAFLSSALNAMMLAATGALFQAVVPPAMQGRVTTLSLALVLAMTPIGLAIAGPAADKVGVQAWFVVGGLVTAALGMIGFSVPAIMRLER
jgi:DHA3 family macrolide efflux protein-like MFS transporter